MILEGTMSHTLTIADLDNFEAEHIAQILYHYKVDMLEKKLEATVEDYKDNGNRAEWFDEHIAWHESIMAKIKWTKRMNDHLANLVFFLLWLEQHDSKQMWGGIQIADAIDSLAAIMGCEPKKLRELIK